MSEHSAHHVPEHEGIERQEASEEFFGEFAEREVGDAGFEGEHGERVHEGRESVSRESLEDGGAAGPMV